MIKDEVIVDAIKLIKEHCISDCDNKRKFYIPIWKQAGYYWNDIQDIYWDYVANNWLSYNSDAGQTEFDAIRDANKIANVYRADGESMIAAATIGNFAIRFYPENANDARDIIKARSYSDIASYLQIKNDIKKLRRQAFALRYQYGLVGAYTYFERNEKYGVIKYKDVGVERILVSELGCSGCEYSKVKKTPFNTAEHNLEEMEEYPQQCPNCGNDTFDKVDEYPVEKPVNNGEKEENRGCSVIKLYGPLELRVPFYAKNPDGIDYVITQEEVSYSDARTMWKEEYNKEIESPDEINPNDIDIEAYERVQADFFGSLSSNNLVTITYVWVLPPKYNILTGSNNREQINALIKEYPDGFKATFIGERLLKCEEENIKDHWTFVESPMDTHIYIRPLGQGSIPIQDMTNDLIYVILQTIKHSTGDTWVNAKIINRKTLASIKENPGSYIPVFPEENKAISDYFFASKSATLSREVDNFFQRLEGMRQHVSGILPSVFGGRFAGGSQTFGEYKQSRDQALQRISMPADDIDEFMAKTFAKATELYAQEMHGDEYYSIENGGGFANKNLQKPHRDGKISRVELVKSEQFPLTWEQQKAGLVELLGIKLDPNSPITGAVFSPDNMTIGSKLIGIQGFKLPGENDRNKQIMEIQKLLESESPDNTGPSIPTDPQVDNDEVHIATIVAFAVSPEGIYQQVINPAGFKNMLLHKAEHEQNIMQKQMKQSQPSNNNNNPPPEQMNEPQP